MKNFTKEVESRNPTDITMADTDFGQWLLEQLRPSSRMMVAIPIYLESLGYWKGRDVIDKSVIRTLGHIHSQYWFKRMKAHPVSQPVGHYSLVDNGD